MKDIAIDCRDLLSRSDLHRTLAGALSFPDHYGNNLDALHDCLTDLSEETCIRLVNWQAAEETLGIYAFAARRAMGDAARNHPFLTVLFD